MAITDNESRAGALPGLATGKSLEKVASEDRFAPCDQREHEVKRRKISVVLVDDDAPLLRALGRLVSLAGFKARAFNRPADVLRARLPKRRGCVVLDLFMPGMDAVELFHALRASGNRLPVVLITGRQDGHSQTMVSQIEHAAVLYKPFSASELLSTIDSAMGRSSPS